MDLNVLNLNINRLLTNIWSVTSFLKEYTVDTAKDVSVTHVNTDGTEVVRTFPNIAKQVVVAHNGALQTVSHLTAIQGSQTITTTDTRINDLAKTIVPKGSNSKFLVTVRWFGECSGGWSVCFNVRMDGVRVNVNGGGRLYGLAMPNISTHLGSNNTSPETVNMQTLVTTNSVIGTPIEFEVVADMVTTATLWNNRCLPLGSSAEQGTSEVIITEIGA